MQQRLDAIYENGIFRPLKHPSLTEGQQVRLIVETNSTLTSEDMLSLAAQVYQGLSDQEISEVEQIACERRDFFGDHSE